MSKFWKNCLWYLGFSSRRSGWLCSYLQLWFKQTYTKPHSLGVPFFGRGIFKRCYTLLWNHTCNELRFFQNFQGKPRNFSGAFAKAFPQPPCFFFLEQTTDRLIDLLFWILRYFVHCTALELFPELPQNKICYRLRPKYMSFSCFPMICSSAMWKSLFYHLGKKFITFLLLDNVKKQLNLAV